MMVNKEEKAKFIAKLEESDDFFNFFQKEFIKSKKIEEIKKRMEQMQLDHQQDIQDFKKKYGSNPSRTWALMRYELYCVSRGIPYDEKGRK